jgi:hypothetical protein
MPAGFRFTAKFPGDVSHEDLREQLDSAIDFTRLMAPLGSGPPTGCSCRRSSGPRAWASWPLSR